MRIGQSKWMYPITLVVLTTACEPSPETDTPDEAWVPNTSITQSTDNGQPPETCRPHFRVSFTEDLMDYSTLTVVGQTCEKATLVHVKIAFPNGDIYIDQVEAMPVVEGYFRLHTGANQYAEGLSEDDDLHVCVAFSNEEYICQGDDEVIPWRWAAGPA